MPGTYDKDDQIIELKAELATAKDDLKAERLAIKNTAVLPDHFFTMPKTAHTTMITPELRSVLLRYDGQIMARGELWTIRNKHIGAGVYRVSLAPAGEAS
jgi:hypothetical protein